MNVILAPDETDRKVFRVRALALMGLFIFWEVE